MTLPSTFSDLANHVGIRSLDQIATAEDRICVLNIMGNESRIVTPVSHTYSGGNVVFGTSAGRQGMTLESQAGAIPIYDNVRSALEAGLTFNTGVVYLPPNAVRDGVAEMVRLNPDLRKVVILTEKVPVRAAREIRAMCHARDVDVFGANCLGVADSWNKIRIGGALGGDAPQEVLKKGSIAIYSNSGNFTNTMATYLSMAGWGTTTLISSGKDVYIQYGPKEFAEGLSNDARSKAAVIYVEPGGYYEKDIQFDKPVVACVVGKWKSNLTRAVGHAGALAGSGDDAEAKEKWLQDALSVDAIFTPEKPVFSVRGAVVTNLAHIHEALNAVMEANGHKPDFAPQGGLELKPWFANTQGLTLPSELDLPLVSAPEPYAGQISDLHQRIGATYLRQNMKDASGATRMDAKTQVTSIYGEAVLDLSRQSVEANICHVLTKSAGNDKTQKIVNTLVGHFVKAPEVASASAVARQAQEAGNSPNTVLAAAVSLAGPKLAEVERNNIEMIINIRATAMGAGRPLRAADFDDSGESLFADQTPSAKALLASIDAQGISTVTIDAARATGQSLTAEAITAALCVDLGWDAITSKRISMTSLQNFPWMLRILGTASAAALACADINVARLPENLSVSQLFHLALTGNLVEGNALLTSQMLTGIVLSNGPGTISAQGAKGAVSADGPEQPSRVQLNKAMIGFLTHTGFSHGGNGYECVEFLMQQFAGTGLRSISDPDNGLDFCEMAAEFAKTYKAEKAERKSRGQRARALPGLNHPVFRNEVINIDPREAHISGLLAEQGQHNIMLSFYKTLVEELHACGATRNVFCVNVDAVIACLLLEVIWDKLERGEMTSEAVERAAFNAFLFGRIIGSIAEIDDHLNRGQNMDTRSAASKCRHIS